MQFIDIVSHSDFQVGWKWLKAPILEMKTQGYKTTNEDTFNREQTEMS